MTRPEEIRERIENIRQIDSIVTTLRALAAAHQVEARAHLQAIRAHEAAVAEALSHALSSREGSPSAAVPGSGTLSIVVGATQGFCGAFADRMGEAARAEAQAGSRLMVIGARTAAALVPDFAPAWNEDMVAHSREIPAFAGRLSDAVFAEIARDPGLAVRLLFADPAEPALPIVTRRLLPFDFTRFPRWQGPPLLISLDPLSLIEALVEEYVFAELCEGLMLGFAAENTARAIAMARARANISDREVELDRDFQRTRQEQMTTEIIEVSSGRR